MGLKEKVMKSIEFVKKRIADGEANVPLQNDAHFYETTFSDYINMFCSQELIEEFEITNGIKIALPSKDFKSYIPVYITYDEDASFEYFTMDRCVCDGTIAFMTDLMKDCFNKIVGLQTCNIKKLPSDFQENPFKYEISYTVGNFVCCEEFGDFGTEEKPWINSRFTVMLPIKFDIKEK